MKTTDELLKILDRFADVTVLVVGDVMLDRYWWGTASRLSPEAPVPVVGLQKVSNVPGGAANVAANVVGLGAQVFLAGVVGEDESAAGLTGALRVLGIAPDFLLALPDRPTTTKTRVIVHTHQIARIDEEIKKSLTGREEEKLLAQVSGLIPRSDIVVLSDYGKGCLTDSLIANVVDEARAHGKMVLADPKSRDFRKYNGVTLLTPNLAEAVNAAGFESLEQIAVENIAAGIFSATDIESLLITLSEQGMKLFRRTAEPVHFPSLARQVFDVTGAGDTVLAALGVALGARSDLNSAIALANLAAGLSVEKVGTSIVPFEEFRRAIQRDGRTMK